MMIVNVPIIVVVFDNVVIPDIFNEVVNVVSLLKFELPLTCNIPFMVVSFDNIVKPETLDDAIQETFPISTVNTSFTTSVPPTD